MTTSVPISAMERQKAKLSAKKISGDLTTRREKSDPIPLDIIWEIFKPLDVKTLGRFICLSKQHASIIRNRDFMKSYLIKASSRPQDLIFTFKSNQLGKNFFFTASDPKNGGESSSLSSSSVATYHVKCRSVPYTTISPSVHGLICHGPPWKLKVYNPSTRRAISLPKIESHRVDLYHYVGYDPIDGDYKFLCMTTGMAVLNGRGFAQEFRVLTLGNGNSWRVIEDCPPHLLGFPHSPDICIDGVLYYEAWIQLDAADLGYAVMSFHVRSEKFSFIKVPEGVLRPKLTNYKGKLALLFSRLIEPRINLWVLEDAAKNEWSKKFYGLPIRERRSYYPFCATNAGELVLARHYMLPNSFHILYYDPKKNTLRRVNIEGISEPELLLCDKESEFSTISIFSGQVDNLMFL